MSKIRITVLKRAVFPEFQEHIAQEIVPCACFEDGQRFETSYEKPQGFCDWAWRDLHPYVAALMTGGTFNEGEFENWSVDADSIIACCTDGVRPVTFELRRI